MNRLILCFALVLFSYFGLSCKHKEISGLEKIIVDDAFIKTETVGYDSMRLDSSNKYKIPRTIYFLKNNTVITVSRNKSGQIFAWFKRVNDKTVEGEELFPNTGQICCKHNYVDGKHQGETTCYYEDGRIRSKGVVKDELPVGTWKHYAKDGVLISETKQTLK